MIISKKSIKNHVESAARFAIVFVVTVCSGFGSVMAQDPPTRGDIVILVDESGSVSNIQTGLANNVVNIANQLEADGIDWRMGIGGFGRGSGGNPRIVTGFTSSVADIQSAVDTLVSSGSSEYGLQAIIDATANVAANYGAVRPGVGYCVVLLTDEDSDYVSTREQQRAAALAGLKNTRAGFIAAVNIGFANTELDYDALVAPATGVKGRIFDINAFVANPDTVVTEIINTCIQEVIRAAPELSINDVTVNESDGSASLEVTVSPASTDPVEVVVSTADGSAIEGNDYTALSQTVSFAANESSKTVTVPIIVDATAESTENFFVRLDSATGAGIADNEGVVTILDSDPQTPPPGPKTPKTPKGGGSSGGGGSGKGSPPNSGKSGGAGAGSQQITSNIDIYARRAPCTDGARRNRCVALTAVNDGSKTLRRLRVQIRGSSRGWQNATRSCGWSSPLKAGTYKTCLLRLPTQSRRGRSQVRVHGMTGRQRVRSTINID